MDVEKRTEHLFLFCGWNNEADYERADESKDSDNDFDVYRVDEENGRNRNHYDHQCYSR